MVKPDRFTKILLSLLVVGVWGLVLRPIVNPAPVQAQTSKSKKWDIELVDRNQYFSSEDKGAAKFYNAQQKYLNAGYEPFAAGIYNGGDYYNAPYVWFRKLQ